MKKRKEANLLVRSHRFYESRPQQKGSRGETVFCDNCRSMQDELERLREENQRLKQRVFYHDKKAREEGVFGLSTPSSQVSCKKSSSEEKQKRKGGANAGHVGHGRKAISAEEADERIELEAPKRCPDCEVGLYEKDVRERSLIESFPLRAKKLHVRYRRSQCPKCFKLYRNPIPGAFAKTLYGTRLIAQAATMHYMHGLPFGRIQDLLGSEVSEGALFQAFHRLGALCEKVMPELIDQYRKDLVRHADETGWRTDGATGFAWVFCTETTSIFRFKNTRSKRVAEEVLGDKKLPGVLIVDRYPGYHSVAANLQYCFAHLLRDVEKLEKEFPDQKEVVGFVSELAPLLAEAMRLRNQPISDGEYFERAAQIKVRVQALSKRAAKHESIRSTQRLFLEKDHRLFHWVDNRLIPPDNNRAERELRPTVIARKVSFGSQSKQGARTREAIMSVLHTVKKRLPNMPVEEWLINALSVISKQPSVALNSLIPAVNPR